METIRVTEDEFQGDFGSLSEKAAAEPVTITKDGRDHLVVLSADEYARLKRQDRRVGLTSELPAEWPAPYAEPRFLTNTRLSTTK